MTLRTWCQRIGLVVLSSIACVGTGWADSTNLCHTVNIVGSGYSELSPIERALQLSWVELGDELLVCGEPSRVRAVTASLDVLRSSRGPLADLILVQGYRHRVVDSDGQPVSTEVLAAGGRLAVVRRSTADLYSRLPTGHGHTVVQEVPWNRVLVRRGDNRNLSRLGAGTHPLVTSLVEAVDGTRWRADVTTLSAWDRYSFRTEIVTARDWIQNQFVGLPGMSVELDPFQLSGSTLDNVVGTLTGNLRPEDLIVVGGHYDATSPSAPSPGAEDNASGCAGVIELARVFAAYPPPATMIFVCYSGEEQGLHGSKHQVADFIASGDDDRIVTMLDMDMIGYTADADLDCLLETAPEFAALLDPYANAAANYTTLRIVTTLNPFGSDHMPFINNGIPALLTIENDYSSYPDYHSSNDVDANVSLEMGYQTLRMNAGALGEIMGIGASLFADGFESGDLTGW